MSSEDRVLFHVIPAKLSYASPLSMDEMEALQMFRPLVFSESAWRFTGVIQWCLHHFKACLSDPH